MAKTDTGKLFSLFCGKILLLTNDEQALEYIGNLITDGFTSGYYPDWKLSLPDIHHDKLSDATLGHISKLVFGGYVEGEVIEKVDRGWWRLET